MLAGIGNVLEIGCGDAFGTALVCQEVKSIYAIDFEPLVLEDAKQRYIDEGIKNCEFSIMNITAQATEKQFDAAYSLDVIEHIDKKTENLYFNNVCKSLKADGVFIIGTPNVTASKYASEASNEGHINLKSATDLKELMSKHFKNVFIFSMNDELVHTGFYSMAHYLFAMGVGLK
jgi:cyclopropane fatty-acyl-phospholipid synthase-like methyltransferase